MNHGMGTTPPVPSPRTEFGGLRPESIVRDALEWGRNATEASAALDELVAERERLAAALTIRGALIPDGNVPVLTFYGYPVAEAIAIIQRAEDAGLTDKSLRTWQDTSRG